MIFDLARKLGIYQEIYFLDDDRKLLEEEKLVIGTSDFPLEQDGKYEIIVAVGDSDIRHRIQKKYEENGLSLVSLIHPEAILPEEMFRIGKGSVIMANAVIQAGCEIGNGVIINTSSSVDHECEIGDFVHISVGSHLAGNVVIGDNTWIGIGTIVTNNVHISKNTTIGAGTVVVKDIVECGTYVGVPAKRIK